MKDLEKLLTGNVMSTEHENAENTPACDRDHLETIYNQLAETEKALQRTLEFFERVSESDFASRVGVSDIRLRLQQDLQRLDQERQRFDNSGDQ